MKYYAIMNEQDEASSLSISPQDVSPNDEFVEVTKEQYDLYTIQMNERNLKYLGSEPVKNRMRSIRSGILSAFDIYKGNVIYGIEIESEVQKEEALAWYHSWLDITDGVEWNTKIIFPVAPDFIKPYISNDTLMYIKNEQSGI